jgi:hypothetical protein
MYKMYALFLFLKPSFSARSDVRLLRPKTHCDGKPAVERGGAWPMPVVTWLHDRIGIS